MLAILVCLVFAGTFVTAALAVLVATLVQRSRRALLPAPSGDSPSGGLDELSGILKQERLSSMGVWQRLLDRINFAQLLKNRLQEAGLGWSVGRVTLAMLLLGSLGFAVLLDASWAPPGAALAGAWIGGSIPYWMVLRKRSQRLALIETQFPDALDSLARAMRAGHALSGGILMLAAETPAPLGPEFRILAEEHRLGLPWANVMENFGRRLPMLEVRLFVAAVMVQTRTGGKLTEMLERLAETIRETAALRGEVKAISAQGRMTGVVLSAMPLFIGAAMYFTNPAYIGLLFSHPTGNTMVWCAAGCMVAGHFVIRRIVDIRAPQ